MTSRRLLVPEISKVLGISPRTTRRLIASGALGVERILGTVGVPEEELARFRSENFTPAVKPGTPPGRPRRPAGTSLGELVDGAVQRARGGKR